MLHFPDEKSTIDSDQIKKIENQNLKTSKPI